MKPLQMNYHLKCGLEVEGKSSSGIDTKKLALTLIDVEVVGCEVYTIRILILNLTLNSYIWPITKCIFFCFIYLSENSAR